MVGGGPGDDTLVWNKRRFGQERRRGRLRHRQGQRRLGGDAFTIAPAAGGRARFDRTNLVPFFLDAATSEELQVNGPAGDDQFSAQPGTALAMIVNCDEGNDSLSGSEGPETPIGGSGIDAPTGGAGPHVLDGEDGDDALNVCDGSFDLARGGAGTDSAATTSSAWTRSTASRTWTPCPAMPPRLRLSRGVTERVKLERRKGGVYIARIKVSLPADETDGGKGGVDLLAARAVRLAGIRAPVASERRGTTWTPARRRRSACACPASST